MKGHIININLALIIAGLFLIFGPYVGIVPTWISIVALVGGAFWIGFIFGEISGLKKGWEGARGHVAKKQG